MGNRTKIVNGILRKDSSGKDKYLCCHCLKSGKSSNVCGISGHEVMSVWYRIRFPSYKASKTRWKECFTAIGWLEKYPLTTGSEYDIKWNRQFELIMKTLNNK